MIECPKCKNEIDNDSRFCEFCGQELHFCSKCGKPGKGNRCTSCGSMMLDAEAYFKLHQTTTSGLSKTERTMATVVTIASKRGIPQMFLVNNNLGIRLAAADGAVIGRRNGMYQNYLQSCPYISGTHAQLNFNAMKDEWTIMDKHSSNGTKVDGVSLTAEVPCALHNGARVQLANVEFVVEITFK